MTHDELLELMPTATRTVIVGGPGTGKSTLARALATQWQESWPRTFPAADPLALTLLCTDDLIGQFDWSECSAVAASWIERGGAWVIEGVATARALRKWLTAHPGEKLDATIVLTGVPFVELTKGQAAMNKGVSTVWNEIAIEVLRRGARVINAASPKPVRGSGEEAPEATAAQ